jgi:hypothetical protein
MRPSTYTYRSGLLIAVALCATLAGEAGAKTHRFSPSHDVQMTIKLRGAPRAGTLLRFVRNKVALRASHSGALRLQRGASHSASVRRGARSIRIRLSGRAALVARRRKVVLQVGLVAEDAVRVRRDRAVGAVRIRPGAPAGHESTAPKSDAAPNAAPAQNAAPAPSATPAPTPAPSAAAPRLFAATSVWNAPLPADAPLDQQSAVLTKTLRDTVAANLAAGTGPWIERAATSPLYTVPANQPTVRVQLDNPGTFHAALQQTFEAVPIPPNAAPAIGPDAHMTVWQPSTDTLWELFKARKLADGWHASYGGAMSTTSRSAGYYDTSSWPGLSQPWWGATATSLPVIAGTIMISELRAGVIPHALALNIPWAKPKIYSFPAQRTDGTSTDPNAIPEGARFRLDPTLDIDKLSLPPMTRVMAKAVQRYGMIVRDQTGTAVSFFTENPSQLPADPYVGPSGFYGGLVPTQLTRPFPWEHLQLVNMTLSGG